MTTRTKSAFVVRAWAQSRIREWVVSSDPALVLKGAPGSGKSTLVGRLTGIGVRPAAVHVCRAPVLSTTEPLLVLASIASALARRVPGYADVVIRRQSSAWRHSAARLDADGPAQVGMAVLDSADAFTAFDRGFRHPLSTLAAAGELSRDLVVVLDGLDEVSPSGRGNDLTDMLATASQRPVPHLRLLMTTRPGPITDSLVAIPELSLDDDPSTVDTILSVLASVPSLRQKTRRTIAKSAQGNFVYAMLAAHAVDVAEPPPGLDSLYQLVLDGQDEVASEMLGVVCRGRDNGLSPSALAGILQVDKRVAQTNLTGHRRVLDGSRLVRPHHRCLVDHVGSATGAAHGRIADYIVSQWGGRWEQCADTYALRNVLPHLSDAALYESRSGAPGGARPAAAMLRETLTDPDYVTAALAVVGVDELRAALSYARYRIAGTAADVDALPALADILHAQAPTLRECRSGPPVTRQLVYEAATLGATDLARGLASRGVSGDVETFWATDDNALPRRLPGAIRGHRLGVTALGVAANGTQAVSAAMDGTTLVWRLASGRLTNTLPTPSHVAAVHPAPNAGQVRAAYSDGTVQVWDLATGSKRSVDSSWMMRVTAYAVANNGRHAVTGDIDRAVTVWDVSTTPEALLRLPRQAGRVTCVAISADGGHVAAACDTGDVTVWDAAAGEERVRLQCEQGATALCLTPRADRIVVGDRDSATVYRVASERDGGDGQTPDATGTVLGRLATRGGVTALAANPAMPYDVMLGTELGQIAYVRVP